MDSLLGRESGVLFPIELHRGGWELTKKAKRPPTGRRRRDPPKSMSTTSQRVKSRKSVSITNLRCLLARLRSREIEEQDIIWILFYVSMKYNKI